jgi:hypothetical protein
MSMAQPDRKRQSFYRLCFLCFGLYLVVMTNQLKLQVPAFHHKKFKPQNLRDWGSESAIDPINPPVYIQASYHATRLV